LANESTQGYTLKDGSTSRAYLWIQETKILKTTTNLTQDLSLALIPLDAEERMMDLLHKMSYTNLLTNPLTPQSAQMALRDSTQPR
jgi:hypothetical protein